MALQHAITTLDATAQKKFRYSISEKLHPAWRHLPRWSRISTIPEYIYRMRLTGKKMNSNSFLAKMNAFFEKERK